MTLNSNQFLQSVEVGFCDRNTCCFNPIPVVVASTQSTAIGVGVPVSLATNTVNSVPKIVASTVSGDGTTAVSVFGFTFIHAHNNAFAANSRTDVLPVGSGAIIYLKAEGAISAGALLSYTISGGTVDTAAAGEVIIGQALIGAAAAGDLIPVYLNQPFGAAVPSA